MYIAIVHMIHSLFKVFVLFDNRIHTYLLLDSFESAFWMQLLLCEKKCFIP